MEPLKRFSLVGEFLSVFGGYKMDKEFIFTMGYIACAVLLQYHMQLSESIQRKLHETANCVQQQW